MRYLNPTKAGLSVGAVLGLWHLAWVSLVAAGWARPVMNYVLRLHFIDFRLALAPFDGGTAVTLVALTSALGFIIGALFASIWNWLTRRPTEAASKAVRRAAA